MKQKILTPGSNQQFRERRVENSAKKLKKSQKAIVDDDEIHQNEKPNFEKNENYENDETLEICDTKEAAESDKNEIMSKRVV